MNQHTVSADAFDVARVSRLKHSFDQHPELTLEALRDLALRLNARNEGHVKFIDPDANVDSAFILETKSHDGRSIDDVFDSIDTPGTWLAIYQAQDDPKFKTVVDAVINSAAALLSGREAEIFDVDAYIFISKAPSVTPFHIDRENNFLLQIRGNKRMSVWDPQDRKAVSAAGVENWIVKQTLQDVEFTEDKLQHAVIDGQIGPGEGVFMPSTAPHMTRTEDESSDADVSVTVGFVFYTKATQRRANILAFNTILRFLGITPNPPREHGLMDSVKFALGFVAIRLMNLVGYLERPRGF
ncbi:MAG: cupin-like domain-containing protein [Pseudomonadota bacterium]